MSIEIIADLAIGQLTELAIRAGGAEYLDRDAVEDCARSAAGRATAAQQKAAGLSWSSRRWWGLDPVKAAVAQHHAALVAAQTDKGAWILSLYAEKSEFADSAAARWLGVALSARHPILGEGGVDPVGQRAVRDDSGEWVSPLNIWQIVDSMVKMGVKL